MAILVCVLFACMIFSGMANASTKTPSTKFPDRQEQISFLSFLFPLMSSNFLILVSDPAAVIYLSVIGPMPPIPPNDSDKDKEDSKGQKDKNPAKTSDNSTSTKPANGKD